MEKLYFNKLSDLLKERIDENKNDKNEMHKYENILKNPYFARIDFKDEEGNIEKIYIGQENIFDKDYNFLVYGINNPIAYLLKFESGKAFYKIKEGDEEKSIKGEIIFKRFYQIENNIMLGLYDSNLELTSNILIDILQKNNNNTTKYKIHQIQMEQNKFIKAENKNMLFHVNSGMEINIKERITYLEKEYGIDKEEIVIIDSDSDFINIIKNEIDDFRIITTFDDVLSMIFKNEYHKSHLIYNPEVRTGTISKEKLVMRYKLSGHTINILKKYIEELKNNIPFMDITYSSKFNIRKNELIEYKRKVLEELPLIDQYEGLFERIKALIEQRIPDVEEGKLLIEENRKKFHITSKMLYIDLFKNKKRKLLEFSKNEVQFEILKSNTIDIINGNLRYEDILSYVYFKSEIEGLTEYPDVKHVIINNAEDYFIWQIKILKLLYPKAIFTIVSNKEQSLYETKPEFKSNAVDDYLSLFPDMNQVWMEKRYKQTAQITKYINDVCNKKIEMFLPRNGEDIEILDRIRLYEVYKTIDLEKFQTVGIIVPTTKKFKNKELNIIRNRGIFVKKGINVLTPYIAKGLSFDHTIIYKFNHYNKSNLQFLFVAMQTAINKLTIYK